MAKKRKPYQVQDKYFQMAKDEGYRARSAFKLQALQERFKILKPGDKVLDLGAAPGSFLQFIGKVIGEKGIAVGVDLKEIELFDEPNIVTFVGDMYDEELNKKIVQESGIEIFDVITSDLAPATTGIKSVDGGQSFELNAQVLEVCKDLLKPGGHVVMKMLPGADESELIRRTKNLFKAVKRMQPDAVRSSSREVYVIGIKKKHLTKS